MAEQWDTELQMLLSQKKRAVVFHLFNVKISSR